MSYTFFRRKDLFDLEKMLDWTARHMDGIDFVTLLGRSAGELRKRVDDLGIPVVCHTFYAHDLPSTDPEARQRGIDECLRGIEAAVTLGAPVAMIPTRGNPTIPRDELRRHWIDGLAQVAPKAREAGITLTVENFPGPHSPFVLAADFLEARAAVPTLGLTYDNGNAATGEDPVDSFRRSAGHVVHIHFKDWDILDSPREGYSRMLDGRYYDPVLIGEGMVDQAACLKAVKESGYTGYINIEYQADKYDPWEGSQRAVDYLRSL